MINKIIISIVICAALCPVSWAKAEEKVIFSPVYLIDKIYKSMTGPSSTQKIYLIQDQKPELLWITGYKAVMVGADEKTPALQEFMCHSNLDYIPKGKQKFYGDPRYFTLSQGQLSIELPRGFGMPVMSNQPLSLTTQVLNLNIKDKTFNVRHRITIEFVRDSELKKPLKPLFPSSGYGMKVLNRADGYYGIDKADDEKHGPSCLVGKGASNNNYSDQYGRKFVGHWIVKPGREINRTLVTKLMNLPYDTMLHYIAVHLHPFAESLELVDLTTKKVLFKSRVKNSARKIGIDRVDYFSSEKGIPLYKNHEYQIISVYNNTTGMDQDSMAVMYLYLLDKDFKS